MGGSKEVEQRGQKGWRRPRGRLAAVAGGEVTSDVDQVVGDDAQPHPALPAFLAAVAATIQSVSPLQETAASFRTRSPFLSPPEPALLLVPAALGAADADSIILGLQDEIRRSQDSRYDHRLHGVLLLAQGMTCPEAARLLGDAPRSVEYWVRRFEQKGLVGLREGERAGRPRRFESATAGRGRRGSSPDTAGGRAERQSVGWQDAGGLDRATIWHHGGCASMPAPVPATGLSAAPAAAPDRPRRCGTAEDAKKTGSSGESMGK